MLAVNRCSIYLFRYCWIHLLSVIVKGAVSAVNLVQIYLDIVGVTYILQ